MARRRSLVGAAMALVALTAAIAAWLYASAPDSIELGRPIDRAQAIGLAEALAAGEPARRERLVLRGQVGEVCLSAGCWFVLQEIDAGRLHELFVDLKKQEGLTVGRDAVGRRAWVSGKLVGTAPDLTFEADGMYLE